MVRRPTILWVVGFSLWMVAGTAAGRSAPAQESTGPAPAEYFQLVQKGDGELNQGRFEEARRTFQQAVELNPGLWVAHYRLGLALRLLGRIDEAIEATEGANGLQENVQCHTELVSLYLQKGNGEAALRHARRATALEPGSWQTHFRLGDCQLYLGHYDDAIAAFEKSDSIRETAQSRIGMGWAWYHKKNYPESLRNFERAAAIDPAVKATLSEARARIAQSEGRLDEAVRFMARAVEEAANDYSRWELKQSLAELYLEQGEYDKAAEIIGRQSWIGISITKSDRGFTVTRVVKNGLADRAGIRAGDKIVAFDGRPLADADTTRFAREIVGGTPLGGTVRLTLEREGQTLEKSLVVGLSPDLSRLASEVSNDPSTGNGGAGPGPGANASGSGGRPPGGGTPVPTIQPLTFQGGAQPAAWHIFATGSRLGWAAAYSRFTDGPADQDIVNHLVMAGEHAMWANRESFEPYRAWPNWSEIQIRFRTWAEQLVRDRQVGESREQLVLSITSYANSLAEQVTFQVLGEKVQIPNCDGAYMRLGFQMGFGSTALQLAEGAGRTGQIELIEPARRDALDHLRQARRILEEYERTTVVTGTCADLRDIRAELDDLLGRADLGEQIRLTGHAWTTAADRIRALSGRPAPPQPATPPQPVPPGPAVQPPRPSTPSPSAALGVWADPGELDGVWVDQRARYRFVKQGDGYVGTLATIFPPAPPDHAVGGGLFYRLADQGYAEGEVVCRAVRTGPGTYRGTYRQRQGIRRNADGTSVSVRSDLPVEVTITVLGDYLAIRSPQKTMTELSSAAPADIWSTLMREGSVLRLPVFDALAFDQRTDFPSLDNAIIWFLASRRGAGGEVQRVLFFDLQDPAVQRYVNHPPNRMLDVRLRSSAPAYQPLREHVNANAGMRRRLEAAGFTVVFGPSSKADCFSR